MFIVVNTAPGDCMSRLMIFLSENGMEFSVTSNLAKLVDPNANQPPAKSSSMFIVINTAPGDSMSSLMIFLSENGMEFSVTSNLAKLVATQQTVPENSVQGSQWNHLQIAPEDPIDDEPGVGSSMENVVVKVEKIERREVVREETKEESKKKVKSRPTASGPSGPANKKPRREEMEDDDSDISAIFLNTATSTTSRPTTSGTASKRSRREETEDDGSNTSVTSQNTPITSEPDVTTPRQRAQTPCALCDRMVIANDSQRLAHARIHTQLKVFQCTVCEGLLTRPTMAKRHFAQVHETDQFVPFIDISTPEEKEQIQVMIAQCFPEHAPN